MRIQRDGVYRHDEYGVVQVTAIEERTDAVDGQEVETSMIVKFRRIDSSRSQSEGELGYCETVAEFQRNATVDW